LAGVPMTVLGIDMLLQRRIFTAVSSLVFTGDPQLVEPRDVIWAVVLLILGSIFILFGLRDLLLPVAVVLADSRGLQLHIGHPLSHPVLIPWHEVEDIGAEDLNDDGSVVPVFWVKVSNPNRLPRNPWGARWLEPDTLGVMAADWERPPLMVAQAAAEVALASPSIADEGPIDSTIPEDELIDVTDDGGFTVRPTGIGRPTRGIGEPGVGAGEIEEKW
jgi:hypothetical protein